MVMVDNSNNNKIQAKFKVSGTIKGTLYAAKKQYRYVDDWNDVQNKPDIVSSINGKFADDQNNINLTAGDVGCYSKEEIDDMLEGYGKDVVDITAEDIADLFNNN